MKVEDIIKSTISLSEEKKAVINLHLASNQIEGIMLGELKKFDISTQQFNVLRILRGQKGKPANLNTLQERMVHKMSNTTRLVDKLIEKKLVSRSICEQNRRKVEIFITEKGLELLKKIDPIVLKIEKEATNHLTQQELIHLNELLEKLRA